MISVYEGVLGGGKSYHAVQHVLSYLATGGKVYTNIELVRDECEKAIRKKYGVELRWEEQVYQLKPSDIPKLHMVAKGGTADAPTLCVVDELHLYHNARDWSHADRELLSWLTQSRKLFVDIIFITQHRNNVDKQWLRLTAGYYRGRDLRKWRIPKIGIGWPFAQFLWIQYDQDGKTVVAWRFEFIDQTIFKCYSSDQIFTGTGHNAGTGVERLKLQRVKGKNMPKIILIVVLAVAGATVYFAKKSYANLAHENIVQKPVPASNVPERRALQDMPTKGPEFVEVEPGLIAWTKTGKFLWAQVNGQRTDRHPMLNKRGEWVYRIEVADLTPEEYQRHMRNMERVRQIELAPIMRNNASNSYQSPPSSTPRPPTTRIPGV